MKFLLTTIVLLNCLPLIFSKLMPNIQDGRYNAETKAMEIDVQYGGGCKEHNFQLQMVSCLKLYPLRCNAELIDLTEDDFCEAFISRTVSISLVEAGLSRRYYNGATININGASDSHITLVLPQ